LCKLRNRSEYDLNIPPALKTFIILNLRNFIQLLVVSTQQRVFPIGSANQSINHSINWAHSTMYKFVAPSAFKSEKGLWQKFKYFCAPAKNKINVK